MFNARSIGSERTHDVHRRGLVVRTATAAYAVVALAVGVAQAAPITGAFDASGNFAAGTDLTAPGTLNFGATSLGTGAVDYGAIVSDSGTIVGSIAPLQGGALPIDPFLEIVGNGYDLDFILMTVDGLTFSGGPDSNEVMFSGQGSVSGVSPTDPAVDGTFGVDFTGQQGPQGDGSWRAAFVSPTAVPAPGGVLLLALGGLGLMMVARRRTTGI